MDDLTRIQPIKRTSLALRSQLTGELHPLSGEMLVGREVECVIQLSSLQISRYHAKLFVSANGAFVEDLQSSNGTFVNGRPVKSRTQIGLGDVVAFDDIEFRVTTARSSKADSTQLSESQKIDSVSVEAINRISSDRLKPAVVPGEQARELPPHEQQTSAQAPQVRTSTQSTPIMPNPREPKVHAIPDMEAFLRFAGSGLKAQEPVSKKEASPFGLARQASGRDNQRGDNSHQDSASGVHRQPPSDGEIPSDLPLEPAAPGPATKAAENHHRLAAAGEVRRPPAPRAAEDEESTKYLSLNTMDRYVATHRKYQQDLDVGSGPRLIVMTAPIRGKVFQLESGEDVKCWSVGRDDSADICLRDQAVSREHAWITKLDSLYQLRVNESASGILVNGQTRTEADLMHGDRLQFGAMEMVFRLDVHQARMTSGQPAHAGWLAQVKRYFGLKRRC